MLQKIKDMFKYLQQKDIKQAEKHLKNEDWGALLLLVDTEIDEAETDVQIASEEDNPQLVKLKSELLDELMNLKYAIEDYIDFGDYDDDLDIIEEDL